MERLVAPAFVLRHRRADVVVRELERDARSDLREPAGDEAVVDLHARDVVREITGCDDPADAPRDHPLVERRRTDGDGAVAHAVESCRMPHLATGEEGELEAAPVEEPEVPVAAEGGDRLPLLVARDPAGRERRAVDEDDAGPVADRASERV